MKKKLFTLCAAALFAATAVQAANVTVSDTITSSTTWSASNIYTLQGYIFVKNGATLTIEPGTIIKGDTTNPGSLIITRGAKIMARGTASAPIVFTSARGKGRRAPGDWGGVLLLGKSPANSQDAVTGDPKIEGFPATVNQEVLRFGGTDTADNSGELSYVRIEFAGIPLTVNNEINGLTLGGVGNGTKIDHVQVSYSGDDAIEWFGGTVNCSHLITWGCIDDDYDTDNGFSGNVQYGISVRDVNKFDPPSKSNAFESDNDAKGTRNKPLTRCVFSNMTCIGPKKGDTATAVNSAFLAGARIRRNSRMSLFNSIIIGWGDAIYFDGARTKDAFEADSAQLENNLLAGNSRSFKVSSDIPTYDFAGYFNNSSRNNIVKAKASDAGLINPFDLTKPDFAPATTSIAVGKASYKDPLVQRGFFNKTSNFMGAVAPAGDNTSGWNFGFAVYDPQNFDYSTAGVTGVDEHTAPASGIDVVRAYPNPSNGQTTVQFSSYKAQHTALNIYDVTGKIVLTVPAKMYPMGVNTIQFDATTLNNGIYIVRLETEAGNISTRISILK